MPFHASLLLVCLQTVESIVLERVTLSGHILVLGVPMSPEALLHLLLPWRRWRALALVGEGARCSSGAALDVRAVPSTALCSAAALQLPCNKFSAPALQHVFLAVVLVVRCPCMSRARLPALRPIFNLALPRAATPEGPLL